jgi:MYXO-CTERM domain-containing protein
MSHADPGAEGAAVDPSATPSDPEAIRADIEQTRAELAETVDALSDKLNVKAQATSKVDAAKHKVADAAGQAKAAAPEPVQHALETVGEKAAPVAHQVAVKTQPHRGKILAGVGAAALVLFAVRRRRQRPGADS